MNSSRTVLTVLLYLLRFRLWERICGFHPLDTYSLNRKRKRAQAALASTNPIPASRWARRGMTLAPS